MIDIPLFNQAPQAPMTIEPIVPQAPIVPQLPQLAPVPVMPPAMPMVNIPVIPEKPKKQDPKKWTPEQVQKAQALYPQETAEKQQRMKTAAIAATPPTAKGTSGAWGKP